jgi:hypothetical protein
LGTSCSKIEAVFGLSNGVWLCPARSLNIFPYRLAWASKSFVVIDRSIANPSISIADITESLMIEKELNDGDAIAGTFSSPSVMGQGGLK